MNEAEDIRNKRIALMRDFDLIRALLSDANISDLNESEVGAVVDMLEYLRSGKQRHLSIKQRNWTEEIARRVMPIEAKAVPRGREVYVPPVLRNLPLKPPGRKS